MRLFLLNVLLALLWAVLNGAFTLPALVFGFLVGYLVIFLAQPVLGSSKYYTTIWRGPAFVLYFLYALFMSSLRVAYDVLTPAMKANPGVIGVPLDVKTDTEITLLANTITLTPGTLSLDVSSDRKTLFIHDMYIDHGDVEAARREIKETLERRVIGLLRSAHEEQGEDQRAT